MSVCLWQIDSSTSGFVLFCRKLENDSSINKFSHRLLFCSACSDACWLFCRQTRIFLFWSGWLRNKIQVLLVPTSVQASASVILRVRTSVQ